MTDSIIRDFVVNQRQLLDLELQSEEEEEKALSSSSTTTKGGRDEQDQERTASHVLGNLEASDISVGLFGRTVVELTVWNQTKGNSSSSSDPQSSPPPGFAPKQPLEPPPGLSSSNAKQRQQQAALIPAHRFTVGAFHGKLRSNWISSLQHR